MGAKRGQIRGKVLFILCSIILNWASHNTMFAQKIKRWPGGKKTEVTSQEFEPDVQKNIFGSYTWTNPDVKSKEILFENGQAKISYAGQQLSAKIEPQTITLTLENGHSITASLEKSNQYYYDLSQLKFVPVVQQRWVSHTTMQSQTVPVTKTRMVTRYVYQNGQSHPQYTTETYTAYEYRSVPVTTYSWQSYTTYVLDIPTYDVYIFDLPSNQRVVIYEIEKDGDTHYFFQTTSFLSAEVEKTKYVIIDANSNGSYFDDADKIMFNTWNPFSKESQYQTSQIYRENKWVSLEYLRNNLFITVTKTPNGNILLENENSIYSGSKLTSKVTFTNLPPHGTLIVNGQKFNIRKDKATYKIEYGKYTVVVERRGFLDFEMVFEVNDQYLLPTINYVPPPAAVSVTIGNIYAQNYFITVKGENGYEKQYVTQNRFSVPKGNITVIIEQNGFQVEVPLTIEQDEPIVIDYEAEVQKIIGETESPEPDSIPKNK